MTSPVLEAINKQIAAEFAASFSYLAMAGWCEHHKFMGAGSWLRLQSAEEHGHAMKLFDFVLARNYPAKIHAMDEPKGDFGSIVEVFERALAQEQEVSQQIDALYELAFREKVFAAMARAAVVHHRAGRGRKDRARNRRQVPHGEERLGGLLDLDRELGGRPAETGEAGD